MKALSKENINSLSKIIKQGEIVVLTGAGISAESNIPTFRGKGGLWEKYEPEKFANAVGLLTTFKNSPKEIVEFLDDFYSILFKATPNPAHFALANLEKKGILNCVITQNIDNLHYDAGSKKVYELHGNAFRIRCNGCFKSQYITKKKLEDIIIKLRQNKNLRIKLLKIFSQFFPRCSCGQRTRIDIVLFGELLPQDVLEEAYKAIEKAKFLFLIGTSGVVYPAAALPIYAKERGLKILEVNNQPSELSAICDYQILGKAGEILPELINDF